MTPTAPWTALRPARAATSRRLPPRPASWRELDSLDGPGHQNDLPTPHQVSVSLAANTYYSFYLVQGNVNNSPNPPHYKWFAFDAADVDNYQHFQLVQSGDPLYVAGATTYKVEDLSDNSSLYPNPAGYTDAADFTAAAFSIDVAPQLNLTGDSTVNEGSQYTLTLGQPVDPDQGDAVTGYTIHWDSTHSDTYTAAQITAMNRQVTHTYVNGPANRAITVDLTTNYDGTYTSAAAKSVLVTASLTWDPDGVNNGVFGGTGSWTATNAWVDTLTNTRYTWNGNLNGGKAVFSGNAGTVTVSGTVGVRSLHFGTSNYVISSGTLLLSAADTPVAVDTGNATIICCRRRRIADQERGRHVDADRPRHDAGQHCRSQPPRNCRRRGLGELADGHGRHVVDAHRRGGRSLRPVPGVSFYLDANGDGQLDGGDTLLGAGTNQGGLWSATVSTVGWAPSNPTGWAASNENVLAQATFPTGSVHAVARPLNFTLLNVTGIGLCHHQLVRAGQQLQLSGIRHLHHGYRRRGLRWLVPPNVRFLCLRHLHLQRPYARQLRNLVSADVVGQPPQQRAGAGLRRQYLRQCDPDVLALTRRGITTFGRTGLSTTSPGLAGRAVTTLTKGPTRRKH